MGFLYFLPGDPNVVGRARLEAAGLIGRVDPGTMSTRGVLRRGPDGGAGMLVAQGSAIAYEPERQQWVQAGDCWIGLAEGERPGPDDLRRDELIDGHAVTLGDGRDWLIPVGRLALGGSRFEAALRIGPDGGWVTAVLPAYQGLVDEAERIYAHLAGAETDDAGGAVAVMEEAEAIELACRLLALNYRVTRWEISLLGLLTTANVHKVLGAFVDLPRLIAIGQALSASEKKSAAACIADGSNT